VKLVFDSMRTRPWGRSSSIQAITRCLALQDNVFICHGAVLLASLLSSAAISRSRPWAACWYLIAAEGADLDQLAARTSLDQQRHVIPQRSSIESSMDVPNDRGDGVPRSLSTRPAPSPGALAERADPQHALVLAAVDRGPVDLIGNVVNLAGHHRRGRPRVKCRAGGKD
jgi:hypothetical protein